MIRAFIAAFVLLGFGSGHAADASKPPFLIELYTAQGCSSCPPADEILTFLARRPDTIALALHVDYWDYSWPDAFAFPGATARQKRYRVAFRNEQVYTPQMVIDGVIELPGNNAGAIAHAMSEAYAKKKPGPEVKLARTAAGVSVTIAASEQKKAEVWLATFDATHTEQVTRGENRGRTITNVNIVRELRSLGAYEGAAFIADVDVNPADKRGIAVFVQTKPLKAIFAAAMLPPN